LNAEKERLSWSLDRPGSITFLAQIVPPSITMTDFDSSKGNEGSGANLGAEFLPGEHAISTWAN
jgi:hypothetical protein